MSERTIWKTGLGLCVLCLVLFAAGWFTREDPSEKPYLQILGGGFIFNYRNAEVFYGFTAQVVRPLASGSIIEARFEDPGGGPPHVVAERVSPMTDRYMLRSPPVAHVKAGKPYHVDIEIYDRRHEKLIWQTRRNYASQVSDEVMPEEPLTVGPGYHRYRKGVDG
ncbi:hypothetical protein [Chelativorans sp. Marseille-P2723]|uniref:hypothetical protein n=1 Tax=Chelativorans sp. Marseille-P2723 TaxID=2709133 RepID=UPI00156F59EB|nr:hypothetical protein [Chelativorans sp. Marseille-P2723]